jgi:tripartite-type tricarboxylate transporter receptor subunit TctC
MRERRPDGQDPARSVGKGIAAAASLTILVLSAPIAGARAEDYFKGKTIHMIVGTPPGGGYDTYARLLARHLADFIGGKPSIIVSNMPGASGTKAASYLYSIAPKDGTVIVTFNKSMPLYQALGQSGSAFKTEEMSWIGNVSQTADIVAVWHTAGVKTIADAKRREVIMGADSSGTMTAYPALLNAALGTRFKIVTGYAGGSAVDHAMEQGEVEGRGSNPWTSWKATRPGWIRDGLITPLVQVGLRKEADLPDVPLLTDLAETDEQRSMFRFISAPASIERPFAGPPGMAPEALAVLRRAFDKAVRDPAFLTEAAQLNLDVDPHSGAALARIVADIVGTPPAIVRKVREIIAPRDADQKSKTPEQQN